MMPRLRNTLIVGTAVVAMVGVGAGVAIAANRDSATTNTSSASAQNQAHAKKHGGLLGRTEHGEFTTRGAKHQVVDVQRGQVQSVSANSITVKSTDGFTASYTVDNTTKVRKDKKAGTISQVATGDQVFVFADKNGSTDTAKRIIDRTN